MFLIGKGYNPRSIHFYRKDIPSEIEPNRLLELVPQLKIGDLSVAEEVINGHLRLAIWIAGLYANFGARKSNDLVGEAFLALVESCHKAQEKLKDNDFTRFAAYRMHCACGKFIMNDRLVRMPISTRYANGLKDRKIVTDRELPNKFTLSPLNQMIFDESLAEAVKSDEERKVFNLRMQGYTHEEISKLTGFSRSEVTKALLRIKKRFNREDT